MMDKRCNKTLEQVQSNKNIRVLESMNRIRLLILPSILVSILLVVIGCKNGGEQSAEASFTALDAGTTGLDFTNKLVPNSSINMLKYMYFYNGAGVGAGDFNRDGKVDLFFTANQLPSKLFLNEGQLKFKDVTAQSGIPGDSSWSTGVSVVDINADGWLDIYICRVGNFESLQSTNQLLINKGVDKDGIPRFSEEAKSYGLNFSGFSTQAAFLDYDLDGDLDMYLMNHSLRFNGTFRERSTYSNTYDSVAGDRFYRNDNNQFVDITRQVGINSTIIGYGLGIAVSDVNLDGYPDIYIGNDFHENDYLYINQKNGSFSEELQKRSSHTSQFSMGVDIADINNDIWPEIISVDMLPYDPYILKRSLGEDAYETFNYKIRFGYGYQYARNNLQQNEGNGFFKEIGLYANVYASDWSWAPLWIDFDNDGLKDLFISNGIPKRLNDIDYVNFVSNDEIQEKIRANTLQKQDFDLINKFPEIKLPNRFYRNKGENKFEEVGNSVAKNNPTFSNGSVYADFDNDGDLDIVVNNIDDFVMLYRNEKNSSTFSDSTHLDLELKGPPGNLYSIGARSIVFSKGKTLSFEKSTVRGFQSSMETPLHLAWGAAEPDSIVLIWPDNSYQLIEDFNGKKLLTVEYKKGLPQFDFARLKPTTSLTTSVFTESTGESGLQWQHKENNFIEFDREPLIPHMVSREGPALAVGDKNSDGLEDVFIGSSKGYKPAVFLQNSRGKFSLSKQPELEKDSMFEETGAIWIDVNNDRHIDLVMASGGNEYFGKDEHLMPRVFLNDGKGQLIKKKDAFNGIYSTASCVIAYDFTGDGYVDLFMGGRAVPWEYGQIPASYLLENNKAGGFVNVTDQYAKELSQVGFVTNGSWSDIDKDNDLDLVLSLEWGGIEAFINNKGKFARQQITDNKGWWNFVLPVDVDADGDLDLVAGNLGLNSRLKASTKEPVRLYYADFDGNDKKEQVLTYYLNGKEIPFANKEELQKQMPGLKKKFLYAEDFAKASLEELLGKEKLKEAEVRMADYFSSAILINEGNLKYKLQELPWQAQLSPLKDAIVMDVNNDRLPDILCVGNFYENNIQMGRYDADVGTVLLNRGSGRFDYTTLNGVVVKGEVRHIKEINGLGEKLFLLAKNNDSISVIKKSK